METKPDFFADTATRNTLITKLRALLEQKLLMDQLNNELNIAKTAFNSLQDDCFNMMAEENIQNMNIENHTMYRRVDTRAYLESGKKFEAFEWLRDNNYAELITETVNSNTLSATVREILGEGGSVPEELIGIKTTNKIGIRRS